MVDATLLELTGLQAPTAGESEFRLQPASWKDKTQTLAKSSNARRAQLLPQLKLKLQPLTASKPKANAGAGGLISPGAPQ